MGRRMLIVGGGLAGLSAGCYGRMNGWETHIFEHAPRLGGVCTAWTRGRYLVDGGIHALMGSGEGGWFRPVFEELGVVPAATLEPLDLLVRYEDPAAGVAVDLTRDLRELGRQLRALSSAREEALDSLLEAAERLRGLREPRGETWRFESLRRRLHELWQTRALAGTMVDFRGSVGAWCRRHVGEPRLREVLAALLSPEVPAVFLPVLLAQLADGQITRPRGGSARVRDALIERYQRLGGKATVEATVGEILIEDDSAVGVRLLDGRELLGDVVISTASYHETALGLVGGRYVGKSVRARLQRWPMSPPALLLTVGVEAPLADVPPALLIKQAQPMPVGDGARRHLFLRVVTGDPALVPAGHALVQSVVPADYDFWSSRRERYQAEKDAATVTLLERIEERLPAIRGRVRMTDLATPLSFWRWARAWRGAYRGFLPTPETLRARVPRRLPGLERLYLAGQWVEPGGGVPMALLSGREVVQILCAREGSSFCAPTPPGSPESGESVRRGA